MFPISLSDQWMDKSLIFHSVYDLNTPPILIFLVEQRPKEIQLNWYDLLSSSMSPTILPLLSFSLVYTINQILSKDFHFPEKDKGYILDSTGSTGDHVCWLETGKWTMQTKIYNKVVSQLETRKGFGKASEAIWQTMPIAPTSISVRQASRCYNDAVPKQGFYVRVWRQRSFDHNSWGATPLKVVSTEAKVCL